MQEAPITSIPIISVTPAPPALGALGWQAASYRGCSPAPEASFVGKRGKPPWEFYSCAETMNSLLSPYPEDFLNSDISLFARVLHLFCAAPRKRKYCTPRENQLEAFWKVISLMVDILEKNKPSKKHCRDCVMGKGSPHAEHKCLSFTTLLYISHACHYQILPISFTSFFLLGRKKR